MAAPASATAAPERTEARVDVLAYPSPTTSRFIVFLAALLTAGAFVGGWLHNQLLRDDWIKTVARCSLQGPASEPSGRNLSAAIEGNAVEERCRASAERRRAAFSIGGAAIAGVAGILVLLLTPGAIERRRRMRGLPPGLAQAANRVAELTRELRLRRAPTVMLGSTSLRDAFSYGTPHRYRVALPPAVAVRYGDHRLFDPLLRHELAHIAHHDVPFAWLARSVWYALAPMLALPLIVGVASGDVSLLPDYLWRAALLAAAVQLVSTALLRSREHDADLRAAESAGGPSELTAVVAQTHRDADPWWRRTVAKHPSRAERLAVLDRPQLITGVTFIDGLSTGFLAGLSIPLVIATVVTLLIGSGHTDTAQLVAAWIAGPLLAGSIGLGLCRAAVVSRFRGPAPSPVPAAIGVGAGLVVGQAASLAHTGIGTASLGPAAWSPIVALLGAGITLLVAGLAELLADAAPVFRRARTSWLVGSFVTTIAYTAVVWIATSLETPLELGWVGTRAWLVTVMASWLVLTAMAVVPGAAAFGLWASRSPRTAPAWLLERGSPEPWQAGSRGDLGRTIAIGAAAGLLSAAALVVFRAVEGPADSFATREGRFYLFVWMAAAAAVPAAIFLAAARPARGAGAAALGALIATLTTVAGWLVMNTVLGGSLSLDFVTDVAKAPLALSFLAVVLLGWTAFVGRLSSSSPWRSSAAVLAGIAIAVVLFSDRQALRPLGGVAGAELASRVNPERLEVQTYVTALAPDIINRYLAVNRVVEKIDADPTADGVTRASRINRDVLPPLRRLRDDAMAYRPRARAIVEVHRSAVAALQSAVEEFEMFAAGYAAGDTASFVRAQRARAREGRQWDEWLRQVTVLKGSPNPAP